MHFVFGQQPEPWSREMTYQAIAVIAQGQPCPGCGGQWQPWAPGERILQHADNCPYCEAQMRYGL